MTQEIANNLDDVEIAQEEFETAIKTLFKITALPKCNKGLLDRSQNFTEEIALQLIVYGDISDWDWYANMSRECGNDPIDAVLNCIYSRLLTPSYIPYNEDLETNEGILIFIYVIKKNLAGAQIKRTKNGVSTNVISIL